MHLIDALQTSSVKPFNVLSLSNSPTAMPPPITPAHEAASKLQKLQISLVDLVSDFLKSVLEVTKANMEMTYGSKFVCDSKVEYILIVPEWWGDDAKSLLVKAAEGAGFGSHRRDFYLISELESSVQYTLKVTQPGNLKVSVHHRLNSNHRD
jgi:hypothetical protein